MEESRKQFEEWASSAGHNISRDARGIYVFSYAATAWIAWQASRAAIEIELPGGVTTREALDAGYMCDYAAGMDNGIETCAKSIRAARLKIKGE